MHKPMGWGNGRQGRECKRGRGRLWENRQRREGRGVRTANNANSREGSSVVAIDFPECSIPWRRTFLS